MHFLTCRKDFSDSSSSCRGSVSGRESVKYNNLEFREYDYDEDIGAVEGIRTTDSRSPLMEYSLVTPKLSEDYTFDTPSASHSVSSPAASPGASPVLRMC